jgi:UDP-N-acetylglucosamine diphosphorylase/glucosamine-1-phosphate N-acetyltransferase
MNYILFDDAHSENLLPLTFTRPTADLRIGITTIAQKWAAALHTTPSYLPYRAYLHKKFAPVYHSTDNVYINARALPCTALVEAILALEMDCGIQQNGVNIAFRTHASIGKIHSTDYDKPLDILRRPYDIFLLNDKILRADYAQITQGRTSAPISSTNILLGSDIFVEPTAQVECSTLNARTGPIYIAANAEIMEGCHVRGALALGEYAALKMATKLYGATTIGPHCKVGGELSNVVMMGYSNKGHDGFLGNSVLGEWCNLGADTNTSNLKNNYENVKLWNYIGARFEPTGLQFCGLIMGDHSKSGINTMFNTGTVVGVGANVFGAGFPRNFLPSFTWGGAQGTAEYKFDKFVETAKIVMQRRNITLTPDDEQILYNIYTDDNR